MDKLAEIMEWKRKEVAQRDRPVSDNELRRLGEANGAPGFFDALNRGDGLAVIAEVKRRSPSAGEIAGGIVAAEQARLYYNAGADALSVLTDEKYFGGSMQDLWDATDLLNTRRDARPALRKDFFVRPIQVAEAAEAGAAAILIIVRALSDDEIGLLQRSAEIAGLDALFEVHTEAELERALRFSPKIVGVNNRDLTRFVTDLAYSEQLIPQMPDDVLPVSESGIFTLEDAARARAAGARAILVGEALMKMSEDDREAFLDGAHGMD